MRTTVLIPALIAAILATAQVQKNSQNKRPGQAAIVITRSTLRELCQYYKTDGLKNSLGAGCFMYIAGVSHTLLLNDDTVRLKSPCPGSGVTDAEITDVVLRWLDDNPAKRDLAAPYLVMRALNDAFPCS